MEDDFIKNGDCWIADYSGGYDKEIIDCGNRICELRFNRYWINEKTGERITRQDLENRKSYKSISDNTRTRPIESYRFEILDFSKTELTD